MSIFQNQDQILDSKGNDQRSAHNTVSKASDSGFLSLHNEVGPDNHPEQLKRRKISPNYTKNFNMKDFMAKNKFTSFMVDSAVAYGWECLEAAATPILLSFGIPPIVAKICFFAVKYITKFIFSYDKTISFKQNILKFAKNEVFYIIEQSIFSPMLLC